MVAQCSTCFFGRIVPTDGSTETPIAPGSLCCQRYAPQAQPIQTGARPLWLWPVVLPDYWCGDYAATDPNVYQSPSEWLDYTPAVVAGSGTIDTISALTGSYMLIGTTCFFVIFLDITTNGTAADYLYFSLPLVAGDNTPEVTGRVGLADDTPIGLLECFYWFLVDTTFVRVFNTANGYPGGDGYALKIAGFYEIAGGSDPPLSASSRVS